MSLTVDQALEHWQQNNLLSSDQVKKLRASLDGDGDHHGVPRIVTVLATIGAVLVGAGVLLFVGSNWGDMTPFQRVAVVFLAYGVIAAGAHVTEQRQLGRVSEALWMLTTLMLGANIFLLAQIYHFSLTYWQGPFLWMIGALAMGYARQEKSHAAIAVPLSLLALGWFGTGSGWGFGDQFEFLFSDSGLRSLLPLIGLAYISLGLLLRRFSSWSFLVESCISWGVIALALPFVITTFNAEVISELFDATFTVKQWFIIILSLLLTAATVGMGDIKRSESKVYLLTFAALSCVMLINRGGNAVVGAILEDSWLLNLLYILAIFLLALWGVWIGIITRNPKVVNTGILCASVIIILQYFSWTFTMLNRSLAFILGGILLITLTIFIEKKRRKILQQMSQ